jgi:predicted nucleic acid-binding protein
MFTVDASVHVSALNPREAGSAESQAFLEQAHRLPRSGQRPLIFSPTLLLVEMAAAVTRAFDDPVRGIAMAQAVRLLPGQHWVPLDAPLAEEAIRLAAECRLRGADAVYAAVAHRYGTILVTLDQRQLERLESVITVRRPAEALTRLATHSESR